MPLLAFLAALNAGILAMGYGQGTKSFGIGAVVFLTLLALAPEKSR